MGVDVVGVVVVFVNVVVSIVGRGSLRHGRGRDRGNLVVVAVSLTWSSSFVSPS